MRNIDIKTWLLWSVKIIAATYNARASASVFYEILKASDLAYVWVIFDTILAVILIDAVFIYVLTEIEDTQVDPFERFPYVLTAIVLSIATIMIGYAQEGYLSIAPRSGLLMLVFSDISRWYAQRRAKYNSREFQEQKMRDEEVLHRRKINKEASIRAMDSLTDDYEEKHRRRYLEQLDLDEPKPERSEEKVVDTSNTEEELPEHVFVEKGVVGWQSPFTNEIFLETTTGKPYTIRGAQIAASRHIAERQKNGHR